MCNPTKISLSVSDALCLLYHMPVLYHMWLQLCRPTESLKRMLRELTLDPRNVVFVIRLVRHVVAVLLCSYSTYLFYLPLAATTS